MNSSNSSEQLMCSASVRGHCLTSSSEDGFGPARYFVGSGVPSRSRRPSDPANGLVLRRDPEPRKVLAPAAAQRTNCRPRTDSFLRNGALLTRFSCCLDSFDRSVLLGIVFPLSNEPELKVERLRIAPTSPPRRRRVVRKSSCKNSYCARVHCQSRTSGISSPYSDT
jgi:hypothetical protein